MVRSAVPSPACDPRAHLLRIHGSLPHFFSSGVLHLFPFRLSRGRFPPSALALVLERFPSPSFPTFSACFFFVEVDPWNELLHSFAFVGGPPSPPPLSLSAQSPASSKPRVTLIQWFLQPRLFSFPLILLPPSCFVFSCSQCIRLFLPPPPPGPSLLFLYPNVLPPRTKPNTFTHPRFQRTPLYAPLFYPCL